MSGDFVSRLPKIYGMYTGGFVFFVVALEIKRELVRGDLRDPRAAALPAIEPVYGLTEGVGPRVMARIAAAAAEACPALAEWGGP